MGGTTTFAIVLASLFALAALAGLAPLAPRFRGAVVAVAGVAGASVACFLEVQRGQLAAPLLAGCVVLSAGGLFYRAAHRSSRVARAMAGFGLVATALFLGLTGGLVALVVEDTSWQSWIGPGSRFLLIAVALGGVLTFLDPRGHGGAWIAGGAFLGWLLIYSGAEVLLEVMPNRAPMRLDLLTDPETLAPATVPFFVTLAAGGVLQVLAWLVRPRAA